MAGDEIVAQILDCESEHAVLSNAHEAGYIATPKKGRKRLRKRGSSISSKTSKMSEMMIENIKDLLGDEESDLNLSGAQPQIMVDTQGEGETIKLSKHKKTRLRKKALKEAFKNIKSIFNPVQASPPKQPEPQQFAEFKPAAQSRIFGGAFSLFDYPDASASYENTLRHQHSDFDRTSRGETVVDDDSDFEFDISAAIMRSNLFEKNDRKHA